MDTPLAPFDLSVDPDDDLPLAAPPTGAPRALPAGGRPGHGAGPLGRGGAARAHGRPAAQRDRARGGPRRPPPPRRGAATHRGNRPRRVPRGARGGGAPPARGGA